MRGIRKPSSSTTPRRGGRAGHESRGKQQGGQSRMTALLEDDRQRVKLLSAVFVLAAFALTARLFYVQVLQHNSYEALATTQHASKQELTPKRGEIYVHDKTAADGITPFATNRDMYVVYATPKSFMGDSTAASQAVAPILGLDPADVKAKLDKKDDVYEPLKHQVSEQAMNELKKIRDEQKFKGVSWAKEEARYYPEGLISSSVTGYVGYVEDVRKGQYGIEGYFDKELAGQAARVDSLGGSVEQAENGDTIILTIDKNIQYKACQILQKAMDNHGGKKGAVIVMNPKTGAIMALCNGPLYDPNKYSEVEDLSVLVNNAVQDQYEPGSVFKVITMASAINEGKITPYTPYNDSGEVKIAGFTIRNSDRKAHGTVDMRTVLEKSLNTGTTWTQQQIGHERWDDYVEAFGFGKRTGVELAGEGAGEISAVKRHKDIYGATTSYGQGLLVTPIQLVQAFGAIANNGVMMRPHLVDRVIKANGYQEVMEPEVVGRPVTAQTAQTVAAMMVGVIDKSATKNAYVDGYYMSGKTGTAQIPREDGKGYDEFKHKDTFMGLGPLNDPQFVILAKVDEPGTQWAEGSVGPIFGELAKYLVDYLEIPPDRKIEE